MDRWHGDRRWRRLLDELLFPSSKEGMRSRSLAYLRLVLADKRGSVLMPTFPRSGQHWTADVLGYAVMKRHSGARFRLRPGPGSFRERLEDPIRLLCPADSRSRHEPRLRDRLPGVTIDWLFHTHHAWKDAALWGLDAARHVFVIRNLPTTLYSCYQNRRRIIEYADFEDFLARSPFLAQSIRFYNSWHAYGRQFPERHRVFRYEDLRRDPAAGFSVMYEWIFAESAPTDLIDEALTEFSLERMKEGDCHRKPDPFRPGYHHGAETYRGEMSEPAWQCIAERMERDLTCDWPGLRK
jgi:hypothetical protein